MADKWQPIKTAPKDGSRILVCYGPPDSDPPLDYDWQYDPVTVAWRTYHPNAAGKQCWRDSLGHKHERARWWQPLPAPPPG
jgi:hypothetical protein